MQTSLNLNEASGMDFPSGSPINTDVFSTKNKQLAEYLLKGGRVTMFDALRLFGIGTPHSRLAEIRKIFKQHGITLNDKFVKVNGTICKEYWCG